MWHTCKICKMNIRKDLIQPKGFHLLEVFLAFFLLLWVIVGHIGGVAPEQVGGVDSVFSPDISPHRPWAWDPPSPTPKIKKDPPTSYRRSGRTLSPRRTQSPPPSSPFGTSVCKNNIPSISYDLRILIVLEYLSCESIGYIATLSMHFLPPFTSSSWAAAYESSFSQF